MDTNRLQELKARGWAKLTKAERVEYKKLKAEAPVEMPTKPEPKVELPKAPEYKLGLWQELPPPIIEWLKINFGGWLNHFEVGKTEWRKDFGGYAMYIKVPEEYSTEWKREIREQYDNRTRRPKVDADGNPMRYEHVTEDIRVISLQLELPRIINVLERVKEHIITNAHRAGIRLPAIGGEIRVDKSLEDYKKSLYS